MTKDSQDLFGDSQDLFGNTLRFARESRGLNQTELAKIADLQPAAIGHFESNRRKPSFANIRALAMALNVSSDYLLGQVHSMEGATTAFSNEENLTEADRDIVQMMINTLSKRNKERT